MIFSFAFALLSSIQSTDEAPATYVQPCQSWRYNSTVGGYVCSWYSFSTQYAEKRDLDDTNYELDKLKRRVDDLEARVERLENPQPANP